MRTPKHGTVTEYTTHRCRCGPCVAAIHAYRREYSRQLIAGERGASVLARLRASQKRFNAIKGADRSEAWLRQRSGYTKKYQAKRRAVLDGAKARPCQDCGGTFPSECMDFDHRDATTKTFCLGGRFSASLKDILAEIAKCDVVCSNCHRTRTRKRRLRK